MTRTRRSDLFEMRCGLSIHERDFALFLGETELQNFYSGKAYVHTLLYQKSMISRRSNPPPSTTTKRTQQPDSGGRMLFFVFLTLAGSSWDGKERE